MGIATNLDELVPGGGPDLILPDSIRRHWEGLDSHKESPSSIVSFFSCPLKWFAERHLEAANKATGDTIMGITDFTKAPSNQWAVGGTQTHRALEVFYSEPPEYRTQELLEEIFDFAWDMLNAGDARDGIVSKTMIDDYNIMLDNLTDRDLPIRSFKSRFRHKYRELALAVLDVERPRNVNVEANESFIRIERGRMKVNGKIDRTDITQAGKEKIVDYKTGKSPEGEKSVFNTTFTPCGIYALARVEEMEGQAAAREVAGVQLMYLQEPRNYNIVTTDEVLDDVDDILVMASEEMDAIGDTGRIPTAPSKSSDDMPCKWCPFQKACPAWS